MIARVASMVLAGVLLAVDGPARGADVQLELSRPEAAVGMAGAELMRYLVSCALPEGAQVANPDSSAKAAPFVGGMGLAPGWAKSALTVEQQRLMSSCLFARTNYFGVPVLLSMRSPRQDGPPSLQASEAERRTFSRQEGAFFGNAFLAAPVAYSCSGDRSPDRERWLRRMQRVCTLPGAGVGRTQCGFVDVGVCSPAAYRQGGVDYADQVIEVHLPP